MLRYTEPVAWPDKDTEVSVAVAMLVPEAEAGKTHLKLLAKVSRALMDDNVRSTLSSGSETEIYEVLQAKLG
ncbi:MAG: PTS sugar transporter subunit IIA [Corynebacterium sp.]|uniref:PTS sugar transporter subunit IIA n=1 Tax=Corynebacterium sp. TaxID=1720 RepID=UPI0026488452|nr:PTS sugar transporter subunit IIA [Corynebacterium sp.]MDN6281712.1 PTS sugar transporter subunit IIA [Corynebacterium sp.]MDN6304200.1 PTS sugar transporter subunit IIA [Corynebacterium sp.]MDN6351781.1 PTS sugar transporter subunit IIA [Corynebacterium sp.]MDN6367497.1 PTS sugar transporter subunit IIA [Corynebacterium sp.]MDN6374720.1 PTS sugar transporter subunit IIA [Corynebacterium sp.]